MCRSEQAANINVCSKKLVDALGIEDKRASYRIDGINTQAVEYAGSKCDLKVSAYLGGDRIQVTGAWEVPRLPALEDAHPQQCELAEYEHLKDIMIPHVPGAKKPVSG